MTTAGKIENDFKRTVAGQIDQQSQNNIVSKGKPIEEEKPISNLNIRRSSLSPSCIDHQDRQPSCSGEAGGNIPEKQRSCSGADCGTGRQSTCTGVCGGNVPEKQRSCSGADCGTGRQSTCTGVGGGNVPENQRSCSGADCGTGRQSTCAGVGGGSLRSLPIYSPPNSSTCSPVRVSSYTSAVPRTCSSLNSSISETAAVCRICHGDGRREQLLSPCYCAGSIGMLHLSCLQRWLGSSNKTHCELCNFQFTMERRPKPFHVFIKNPGSDSDKKHLICDFVCFSILSPLTIAAVWFCLHGALSYNTKKLESIGLSTLGATLLILYVIWLTVCIKHNINLWRDWQQFNQDVKLKCHPPAESPRLVPIPEGPESSTMPSRGARRGTVKLCSIEIKVTTGGDTSPRVQVSDKRGHKDIGTNPGSSSENSRRHSPAGITDKSRQQTQDQNNAHRWSKTVSKETYV